MHHRTCLTRTLPVALVLGVLGCRADQSAPDPCRNTMHEEVISPTGARKAVVFTRACGSEASTRLAILDFGASLDSAAAGFAVVDSGRTDSVPPLILPDWPSDSALIVRHLPLLKWQHNEPRSGVVSISYEPIPTSDPLLIDVSGDDCTASSFVYNRAPAEDHRQTGIAFINDGCMGDRIFLGFGGVRHDLTRSENVPLGTGGPYTNDILRVEVTRGRQVKRIEAPVSECHDGREWELEYEAYVVIRAGSLSWPIDGTLTTMECAS